MSQQEAEHAAQSQAPEHLNLSGLSDLTKLAGQARELIALANQLIALYQKHKADIDQLVAVVKTLAGALRGVFGAGDEPGSTKSDPARPQF